MAIVVLTVLLTSIAPMIVLSVATRVQARRVELATQAAWSYVDAVRAGSTEDPLHLVYIDTSTTTWAEFGDDFAMTSTPSPALPTCTPSTSGYPYCLNSATSSLYCLDLDENSGCTSNSAKDMIVQAFRTTTTDPVVLAGDMDLIEQDAERGYLLGVRVYRADAFSDSDPLKAAGIDGDAGTTGIVTSGLGLRKVPLIEVTTEIPAENSSFNNLCDRVGCD